MSRVLDPRDAGGARGAVLRYFTEDLRGGRVSKRITFISVVMCVALGVLAVRIVTLQTLGGAGYREASLQQRTRVTALDAERGSILDRDGKELAIPVPTETVYADPRFVTDPVGTARAIAGILQLAPEAEAALVSRLAKSGDPFEYVARQASPEVAATIMALKLPGISSRPEQGRAVTSDGLRAVVGRTDVDGVGISGLEQQYEAVLAGIDGRIVKEVNAAGKSISAGHGSVVEAAPGGRLVTTLSRNIQFQVDAVLQQQVERLGAKGGTAIVMDAATGEIWALSAIARREDGTYGSDAGNIGVVEAHEPGSVAKVFSIAAALDQGGVDPSTTYLVPGKQVFGEGTDWRFELKDAYPHPTEEMTLRKIIVDSSNLGTIQVSQSTSLETQFAYLTRLGFGKQTALDYPGETTGLMRSVAKWQGTEQVTYSYGYGYATSAVQLVAAVNAVANGGVYVAPSLVRSVVRIDGSEEAVPPAETRQVYSAATAATMRQLLTDVVCHGTGKLAKVPGMSVAGKTGTAYKRQDNGTYVRDDGTRAYYATFVGFLPAQAPRFTVLVSIDEPLASGNDRFGGTAAAPVFARIASALINEAGLRPPAGDVGCVGERPAELGPGH
ncbi:MAG: peptidoglycan D,D-transpeptidase FtsI family protein [Ilumatobacteraceae bacterium]